MSDKNNKKMISLSIVITATALFGLIVANANTATLIFGQQTSGQVTKGTIIQGVIKSAALTNGQIKSNTVNNGELVKTNITGATIINAEINTAKNGSSVSKMQIMPQ